MIAPNQPMNVGNSNTGSNGFFSVLSQTAGSLFSNIGQGVGEGLRSALPNWTAKQLTGQTVDQLNNNTFDARYADPRLTGQANTGQVATYQPAGLLFDNININAGAVLLIAAAVIGVVLVAKS